MNRVKQTCAYTHAQDVPIILIRSSCAYAKVSSGPLLFSPFIHFAVANGSVSGLRGWARFCITLSTDNEINEEGNGILIHALL